MTLLCGRRISHHRLPLAHAQPVASPRTDASVPFQDAQVRLISTVLHASLLLLHMYIPLSVCAFCERFLLDT